MVSAAPPCSTVRTVLLPWLLAVLAAWGGVAATAQDAARRASRPNIVFVYADDHAQAAVGAYGCDWMETPNIDRLATEGVRFERSFVANSICGPARATVLTGLHSHANGQMTNRPGFRRGLPTFASMLRTVGYRTAVVGKWHLPGDPVGFDHWELVGNGSYYNMTFRTADGPTASEGYTTDVITEKALGWIEDGLAGRGEDGDDRPFCVWICHTAAHRTWMPPTRHLNLFRDRELPEPPTLFDDYDGRSPGAAASQMRVARDLFPAYDLKLPVTGEGILDRAATGRLGGLDPEQRAAWDAAYAADNAEFLAAGLEGRERTRWNFQRYLKDYSRCVTALDDSVGRVLSYLDDRGLAEDTVVIYASDQGFFLGEHGWYDKRWMYEPAFRTPMFVRWPGRARAGTVDERLVQNIDVAPTLLEVAGVTVPDSMHGRSLLPLLAAGPDGEVEWRDAVYYHYQQVDSGRTSHTVARHYGIRTARYKLIHVYDHEFWELYDLERDPEEVHNLADDPGYAEVRTRLTARLRELREEFGDTTGKAL